MVGRGRQHALICRDGFIGGLLPFIELPQGEQGLFIFRVNRQRVLQRLFRVPQFSLALVHQTQVIKGLGEVRIQLDGLFERLHGFRRLPLAVGIHDAEQMVGLGEFGPDGDRLSQRFSGVVVFALRGLSHGLVIELFGVVGLYWSGADGKDGHYGDELHSELFQVMLPDRHWYCSGSVRSKRTGTSTTAAIANPPSVGGSNRHVLAAFAAAWSSEMCPEVRRISTSPTLPSGFTSTRSSTVPCQPISRARRG